MTPVRWCDECLGEYGDSDNCQSCGSGPYDPYAAFFPAPERPRPLTVAEVTMMFDAIDRVTAEREERRYRLEQRYRLP